MKIGLITDSISDNSTGIGYYSKYFIDLILNRIHNIDHKFIDYKEKDFINENLLLVKNPFRIFKTHLWHNILPLKLRHANFDLIFNFTSSPHFLAYKQKEIFFVYDVSWIPLPQFHPFSRVILFKLLFNTTLKNSFKIVTDSYHAKSDLIKYFRLAENKIVVIYPPFPKLQKKYEKPAFSIDNPYLLYVGTIKPTKNIETIIKAYYELRNINKIPHKLVICGNREKSYKNDIKIIEELGLEKEIIYTGYVNDAVKAHLYKNADVFVSPSLYEGFGLPLLESMYYGCPVVTSNVSSIPEVVGNAAVLVNPQNIKELKKAVYKVIQDTTLRKKLIKLGFNQVKKFENVNISNRELNKLFSSNFK